MSTTNAAVPVVFIHGLWLHATSWEPWVTLFEEAGHAPLAPGWPGEPASVAAARANPSAVAGKGIVAVADHYAGVLADLPTRPILVGHSVGGLIAQILLCRGLARAAVALDPAPFRGVLRVPSSALRFAMVALKNPLNRGRALSLTREQWRYGFANALDDAESSELYERLTVPSPARPLFEAALANLNPATPAKVRTSYATRGPLLITAGDRDHAVPGAMSRWAARQYAGSTGYVELLELAGRGHSLVIDHGWREVADRVLSWIAEHVPPHHEKQANPKTLKTQKGLDFQSRPAHPREGSRLSPVRRAAAGSEPPEAPEPPHAPAESAPRDESVARDVSDESVVPAVEPVVPDVTAVVSGVVGAESTVPGVPSGGPDVEDGETYAGDGARTPAPAVNLEKPEPQVGSVGSGASTGGRADPPGRDVA